jgi:hypothetical protein
MLLRHYPTVASLCVVLAGRVVLNEFATPPEGVLGYAQQVRTDMLQLCCHCSTSAGSYLKHPWVVLLNTAKTQSPRRSELGFEFGAPSVHICSRETHCVCGM